VSLPITTHANLNGLGFGMGLLLLSMTLMKVVSVLQSRMPRSPVWFFLSPLFSVDSWRQQAVSRSRAFYLLGRAIVAGLLLWLTYYCYFRVTEAWRPSGVLLGYLALPTVLLWGETLGPIAQLLFAPSGHLLPPHHRIPLAANSISEFWGRRWNVWVSDWYRQIFFKKFRRNPGFAVVAVFLFSGIWHELLINVPSLLLLRANFIGGMILYFLIQAVGIFFERRFLPRRLRVVFAWIVIIAPAPLVMHEGFLRALGLWQG